MTDLPPGRLLAGPEDIDLGPIIVYRDDLEEIVEVILKTGHSMIWIEADGRRFDGQKSIDAVAQRVGPRTLRELRLVNDELPERVNLHLGPDRAILGAITQASMRDQIVPILARRRRRLPRWLARRLRWYSTVHLTPWRDDLTFFQRNRDAIVVLASGILGGIAGAIAGAIAGGP